MLGLAALALGVIAALSRTGVETGAADWRGAIDKRNARHARHEARGTRKRRPGSAAPRGVRRAVDCCAAGDDNWRAARAVYDRWTAPTAVSYREALQACWNESVEAASAGDYSKPASRRCALGKMHASKLAQWLDCRQACGGGADPFAGPGVELEFAHWPAEDGSGGLYWAREASRDVVRVSPTGDGWRVDFAEGSAWRHVADYADESAADDAARDLLDVPF